MKERAIGGAMRGCGRSRAATAAGVLCLALAAGAAPVWEETFDDVGEWGKWAAALTVNGDGSARLTENDPSSVWGKAWVHLGPVDVTAHKWFYVRIKALTGRVKLAVSGPWDGSYQEFATSGVPGQIYADISSWPGDTRMVFLQLIVEGDGAYVDFEHAYLGDQLVWARYADKACTNPVPPYESWATAATNIQDAVDAAGTGDTVFVAGGVYDTGQRAVFSNMPSRVVVDKPILVTSVSGPASTIIRGQGPLGAGAVRCAYVARGATLAGFTLTNGHTRTSGGAGNDPSGGGAWCEGPEAVVSNCLVTGNSAWAYGGGAFGGTLRNCTLAGNSAASGGGAAHHEQTAGCVLNFCTLSGNRATDGGGAYLCTLNNCTVADNVSLMHGGGAIFSLLFSCAVAGNSAGENGGGTRNSTLCNCTVLGNSAGVLGGGVRGGTVYNCIVYSNAAPADAGSDTNRNYCQADFTYSCTSPLPPGRGNITNDPAFVNPAAAFGASRAAAGYRLLAGSPCVNVGTNQWWMHTTRDIEGRSRIVFETVDMGCCETVPQLSLRLFLQGPYSADADAMGRALSDSGVIPKTAPHAADRRLALLIPTNTTDWVLLEVRSSNGVPQLVQSALLQTDGSVLAYDGSPTLTVEVPKGSYYLLAKHRNHLAAMSAFPVPITNVLTSHDFTTGSAEFLGGTNAAVELEPGVWGMIAGDADGDGKITWVDSAVVSNQVGKTGYLSGDVNLDGVVTDGE